ncbi:MULTISPECIES: hypothetical protein [Streptomyces]|uniref:Uncharacterized protein n=1 Tax=Streptomyces cacaoi TaxID=1898 RepID=A0A4Y3R8K4_STRCI|nr:MULTISPECIES: hypothetical protein [Streptomyces]NNG86146.1 hypothetical protein [Streptomyces cacaoi]QHF93807.1 hypothetical protein DEH18_07930 [Streptomyces sp. NHF165]GEB53138.1 hypothetical protein SCA03_56890 [Streptomyces cacaoi]
MRTARRALVGLEQLLRNPGAGTARRNAWRAVQEDRARARARREAQAALDAALRPQPSGKAT